MKHGFCSTLFSTSPKENHWHRHISPKYDFDKRWLDPLCHIFPVMLTAQSSEMKCKAHIAGSEEIWGYKKVHHHPYSGLTPGNLYEFSFYLSIRAHMQPQHAIPPPYKKKKTEVDFQHLPVFVWTSSGSLLFVCLFVLAVSKAPGVSWGKTKVAPGAAEFAYLCCKWLSAWAVTWRVSRTGPPIRQDEAAASDNRHWGSAMAGS